MITSSDDFFKNFEVNNNIECLTELVVGLDIRSGFSVHVNPDPKRDGDEYFKIYNSPNYNKAKKIARIKFKEPKYVIHQNKDGKVNWSLNSCEKKNLIDFLSSKNSKNPNLTNWEVAIILFNAVLSLSLDKNNKKIKYNKSKKQQEPLSLDLKMPDYKKLVNPKS